jgi:hypothetical protein
MRDNYDSDKRKKRYAEKRDEIRQREKENYRRRKEENSKLFYTELHTNCITEDARGKLKAFIDSEGYKADTTRLRQYWTKEAQKKLDPDSITSVTLQMSPDQ